MRLNSRFLLWPHMVVEELLQQVLEPEVEAQVKHEALQHLASKEFLTCAG